MNPSHPTERWHPSVTVAAIIERGGKFLLVQEHTPEGLRLNNPAGHLDPGESLIQACAREVLEETAHPFTPTGLLGIYMSRFQRPSSGEDITYLRFAFCGDLGAEIAGQALDEGIVRTLWMTPDEMRERHAEHRSPLVMRCVEDYLRGQRLALDALHTDSSVWASSGT
jgi:phosphatase NudJ